MSQSPEERLKARKPVPKPVPAYLPTAGSPLSVDKDLYAAIQQAPRVLVEEFTVPIRSGRAWEAPAGSIIEISTPEGPQVGKLHTMSLPLLSTRTSHHSPILFHTKPAIHKGLNSTKQLHAKN